MSLVRMRDMVRSREISPVELVEAHLKQIHAVNSQVNAFIMVLEEQALACARKAEQATAEIGALHGIPFSVKDSFDVEELPTYCGSALRLWHRADKDSTAVARLREAGGILLGKTNCPEFLMMYESDNRIIGRTNNPWNLDRTAGGSSGGEAAAIASFCSPGGVGSDGGGSVREPAHFCGIAGLKPTPGRVSAAGHVPEIAHPGGLLGVAGPMARTAEDVRLLFEMLAGYDPRDPFSAPVPLQTPNLEGLTIGVMEQWLDVPVQAPVRAAVRAAAGILKELGFATRPFRPQGMEDANALWWFFFGEVPAPLIRALTDAKEEAHWTSTELISAVPRNRQISGVELVDQLGRRDRMRLSMLDQMRECPVLLMPVAGVTAFPHGTREWMTDQGRLGLLEAMAPLTPFNLFGMPGMVIPMGFDPEGLPIGVQLVGRPFEEEVLLELTMRMEEVRGPLERPRL
jgi:Asp-tRNA(Asn)/Glu-tRNA(Gln) amidotransferase A subunit family amidase